MSGVSNLFTREFFRDRARRARAGRTAAAVGAALRDRPARRCTRSSPRCAAEFRYVYGFALRRRQRRPAAAGDATSRSARDDLPRWEELPPRGARRPATASATSRPPTCGACCALAARRRRRARRARRRWSTPTTTCSSSSARRGCSTRRPSTPNWRAFAQRRRGVLPLLEAVGEPLDARELGALALSYAQRAQATRGRDRSCSARRRGRAAAASAIAAAVGGRARRWTRARRVLARRPDRVARRGGRARARRGRRRACCAPQLLLEAERARRTRSPTPTRRSRSRPTIRARARCAAARCSGSDATRRRAPSSTPLLATPFARAEPSVLGYAARARLRSGRLRGRDGAAREHGARAPSDLARGLGRCSPPSTSAAGASRTPRGRAATPTRS